MFDFNNRFVQMGVKAGVVVLGLLAVFLLSKTITEVVSWGKNTEMYPTKTISVNASGEAIATADIASFSFTVNESADTSEAAQANASAKIEKALKYFKDNGVEDEDIKTEYYNIYPKYAPYATCYAFDCPTPTDEITGYEVSQSIRVKVRDSDNAGKFLSELTKFEINNVSGLTFTIDDEDALYDLAREDAIQKAQEKADELAKKLGVKLGDIVSFSESNPSMYRDDYGYGISEMSAKSDVSLPKGENTFTTEVYITYELK